MHHERVSFLGCEFDAWPFHEAVQVVVERVRRRQSTRLLIANANSFAVSRRRPELITALQGADLLFADGSGLLWASAFVGEPLKHNLNGTDLIPAVCAAAARHRCSIFLLGGQPGVAEEAARRLQQRFPGLRIAGVRHGFFSAAETPALLEEIRASGAQLLLVALGSPLQEIWIDAHSADLPGVVCASVGGLFDFLAERVRRAPMWLRRLGLEWTWRIAMEPRRLLVRYLVGNTLFVAMVLRDWWAGPGPERSAGNVKSSLDDGSNTGERLVMNEVA